MTVGKLTDTFHKSQWQPSTSSHALSGQLGITLSAMPTVCGRRSRDSLVFLAGRLGLARGSAASAPTASVPIVHTSLDSRKTLIPDERSQVFVGNILFPPLLGHRLRTAIPAWIADANPPFRVCVQICRFCRIIDYFQPVQLNRD